MTPPQEEYRTSRPCDEARFWAKVNKSTECWTWTAGRTGDGYGAFWIYGKTIHAHVFTWIYILGHEKPNSGMVVDHICRTRECVRPDHLRLLDNATNVLTGFGPSAVNKRKTHCQNGHLLAGENLSCLKRDTRQKRQCKICRSARKRAFYARYLERNREIGRMRQKATRERNKLCQS